MVGTILNRLGGRRILIGCILVAALRLGTGGLGSPTENIEVVDEQGNVYGATYPKRAKGLVKNGRARFVGENRICLACPPETTV